MGGAMWWRGAPLSRGQGRHGFGAAAGAWELETAPPSVDPGREDSSTFGFLLVRGMWVCGLESRVPLSSLILLTASNLRTPDRHCQTAPCVCTLAANLRDTR